MYCECAPFRFNERTLIGFHLKIIQLKFNGNFICYFGHTLCGLAGRNREFELVKQFGFLLRLI